MEITIKINNALHGTEVIVKSVILGKDTEKKAKDFVELAVKTSTDLNVACSNRFVKAVK